MLTVTTIISPERNCPAQGPDTRREVAYLAGEVLVDQNPCPSSITLVEGYATLLCVVCPVSARSDDDNQSRTELSSTELTRRQTRTGFMSVKPLLMRNSAQRPFTWRQGCATPLALCVVTPVYAHSDDGNQSRTELSSTMVRTGLSCE